jgi:hypothetical protein
VLDVVFEASLDQVVDALREWLTRGGREPCRHQAARKSSSAHWLAHKPMVWFGSLNLVWAVLDRASRGWRGFTMTLAITRQLADLRHQLLDPPTQLHHRNTDTDSAPPYTVGAVA